MMDINEFLIQATLASIRAGKRGDLAACDALSAAKLLLTDGVRPFQDNTNLSNFKSVKNIP